MWRISSSKKKQERDARLRKKDDETIWPTPKPTTTPKSLVTSYTWTAAHKDQVHSHQEDKKKEDLKGEEEWGEIESEHDMLFRDNMIDWDYDYEASKGPDYIAMTQRKRWNEWSASMQSLLDFFHDLESDMSPSREPSHDDLTHVYHPLEKMPDRGSWETFWRTEGPKVNELGRRMRRGKLRRYRQKWPQYWREPKEEFPWDEVWSLPKVEGPKVNKEERGREIFLEERVLKADWPEKPAFIHLRTVDDFFVEASWYRDIHIENWFGYDGYDRTWHCPTRVKTWFGEKGTVWGLYDASFWIHRFPSTAPGRHHWDTVIGPNRVWLDYRAMRREHPAPPYRGFSCKWIEDRDVDELVFWNHFQYKYFEGFDVRVQVFPGVQPLTQARGDFGDLQHTNISFLEMGYWAFWSHKFFGVWDPIPIRHFQEPPHYGNFYRELKDPFLTPQYYHNKYTNRQVGPDHEYLVYLQHIDDDAGIMVKQAPRWDYLHAFENFDVSGAPHEDTERYEGTQYVISKRGAGYGGEFWWYPRNYTYEMQRGMVEDGDYFSRRRVPLFEKMTEFSQVGHGPEARAPWRKGAFQNLGFFMKQFAFHALPFIRRVRIAVDVLTRPFSYKDDCPSRLDGTLWIISRISRIISQKNFTTKDQWKEFKGFLEEEGQVLEKAMDSLLTQIKPSIKLFNKIYWKIMYAKIRMENAEFFRWAFSGGKNYSEGLFHWSLFQGIKWYSFGVDAYFGVPSHYTFRHNRRKFDEHHEYHLETFPYKSASTMIGDPHPETRKENEFRIKCEQPERPAFVPFDPNEQRERIPYNFYWINDSNCHVQIPLEHRTINFKEFDFSTQTKIFTSLFHNATDAVNIATEHFIHAQHFVNVAMKPKAEGDLFYMTPFGPMTPQDPGFHHLKEIYNDKEETHLFDNIPLMPFEEMLKQLPTYVDEAASRFARHMLGPGAARLQDTCQQIFDLCHEYHMIREHLFKVRGFLKANTKLFRGLSKCRNFLEVGAFLAGKGRKFSTLLKPLPSSLVRLKNRKFYVVRFSINDRQNMYYCSRIPPQIPDTTEYVQEYIKKWAFMQDGRHSLWYRIIPHEWGKFFKQMRLSADLHIIHWPKQHLTSFDMHSDQIKHRADNDYRNPIRMSGIGERRRKESRDNFFPLEDDRVYQIGAYKYGRVYIPYVPYPEGMDEPKEPDIEPLNPQPVYSWMSFDQQGGFFDYSSIDFSKLERIEEDEDELPVYISRSQQMDDPYRDR